MTDAAQTPDDLHQELKDKLRWLCSIFGQPCDLLRLLSILEWRRLRIWLRSLEALAARLVRALAATMPSPPETAPRPSTRTACERTAPDTDHPESERWIGVRFRWREDGSSAAPPPMAAQGSTPGAMRVAAFSEPEPRGFRSARRLALRLEAVIRVAENAHRYAQRRLGRLARKKAQPVRRALQRIAPPAPRTARITALGPPIRPPMLETG